LRTNHKKGEDQRVVWVGERLRLERTWGDRFLHSELPWVVHLPGLDVHPQLQEVGEKVITAKARAEELRGELAAQKAESKTLPQRLADEPEEVPRRRSSGMTHAPGFSKGQDSCGRSG
jgi:hypothetical protein